MAAEVEAAAEVVAGRRRDDQPLVGRHLDWRACAARDTGWSAEIEIPFRTLNFNPNL